MLMSEQAGKIARIDSKGKGLLIVEGSPIQGEPRRLSFCLSQVKGDRAKIRKGSVVAFSTATGSNKIVSVRPLIFASPAS